LKVVEAIFTLTQRPPPSIDAIHRSTNVMTSTLNTPPSVQVTQHTSAGSGSCKLTSAAVSSLCVIPEPRGLNAHVGLTLWRYCCRMGTAMKKASCVRAG